MPKTTAHSEIHLKDYVPTPYSIPDVSLTFHLSPTQTIVDSTLKIVKKAETAGYPKLVLNGENLKLVKVALNGVPLTANDYHLDESQLILNIEKDENELEIQTEINPKDNDALEGLYISDNIYCTQNEAQGFRKITYFYDRPDVLSKYRTMIVADKSANPVLLSNGNPVETGDLDNNRHYAVWEDPFLKPCYLYALVAGKLVAVTDSFKTMHGRTLDLRIYVDPGNEDKCDHAMASLKRAMKWDEEVFGRECDLDTYMIVAVSAFNFGAMENKGLNIFNSQLVLANPSIATDSNYEAIEGVIGHEYFHNWSGNRVTCRDWFQITLKEGLTVFRDQEFSSDMGSRPVKRIADVKVLRDYQFVEDSGPNAHPIQPQSYIEINNFYTSTVYLKGAEIIRMVETLIDKAFFRKGLDHYFSTYDGQAVTTEEFVSSMEQVSGFNLQQFRKWYGQPGTPRVSASLDYDEASQTATLNFEQFPPKIKSAQDIALHIPVKFSLYDLGGAKLPLEKSLLELKEKKHSFSFQDIKERPIPSLFESFSSPVMFSYDYSPEELALLLGCDEDPFNRYEAGQRLCHIVIKDCLTSPDSESAKQSLEILCAAFSKLLNDSSVDGHFKSYALGIPSLTSILEQMDEFDVQRAYEARKRITRYLANHLKDAWMTHYNQNKDTGPYQYSPDSIAKRAYKNLCLHYLCQNESEIFHELAYEQMSGADNMTEQIGALSVLVNGRADYRDKSVEAFYQQWHDEQIVMNKWFAVQSSSNMPEILSKLTTLESDKTFQSRNPNKLRALYGAFAQNLPQFHHPEVDSYRWLADRILRIDQYNPKVAAQLATNYKKFSVLPTAQKERMRNALEHILSQKNLSADTYEIASKTIQAN